MTEIPNGQYRAKAREGRLGHTSAGREQVAVLFELLDEAFKNVTITWHGYFTVDTIDRTLDSLSYCGWDSDNIYDLTGIGKNEVVLVIENETYQGKTHPKVQWVNRAGGIALKAPMSNEQAKAFDAKLRGNIAAWKQKQGQPRTNSTQRSAGTPPRGNEPPPHDDKDIPF